MIYTILGAYAGGALVWFHQESYHLAGSRRVLAALLWPLCYAIDHIEALRRRGGDA